MVELLRELKEERSNKLNRGEYDMASWSTRTWRTLAVQRISVAAHLAAFAWVGNCRATCPMGDRKGRGWARAAERVGRRVKRRP